MRIRLFALLAAFTILLPMFARAQVVTEDVNDPVFLQQKALQLKADQAKLKLQWGQLKAQGLSIVTIRKVLWPSIVNDYNEYLSLVNDERNLVQANIAALQAFHQGAVGYKGVVSPTDWINWFNNTQAAGKAVLQQVGIITAQSKSGAVQTKVSENNMLAAVGTKGAVQGLGALVAQQDEQLAKANQLAAVEDQAQEAYRSGKTAQMTQQMHQSQKDNAVTDWLTGSSPSPSPSSRP